VASRAGDAGLESDDDGGVRSHAFDSTELTRDLRRHRPWMSWLLVASILATFVAQLLTARGGFDVLGTAWSVRPEAIRLHRFGSFISYAWVHALPSRWQPFYAGFHLVSNVVPLFFLAPALERRLGPWWLLALFCGGAVAAALAWVAWHPLPGDAMIGASGALFALIGAAAALDVRAWYVDCAFWVVPMRLNMRSAAVVLCAFEAAQLLWRGLPNVAHVAHLGGALFGAVFAILVPAKRVEL